MTDFTPSPKVRAWASANGFAPYLEAHAEYFADYLANKTGKPYKDIDAAFRNCIRGDWGGIRRQLMFAEKKRDDWQANDQTICAKAESLGISTRGKYTQQLVREIQERVK